MGLRLQPLGRSVFSADFCRRRLTFKTCFLWLGDIYVWHFHIKNICLVIHRLIVILIVYSKCERFHVTSLTTLRVIFTFLALEVDLVSQCDTWQWLNRQNATCQISEIQNPESLEALWCHTLPVWKQVIWRICSWNTVCALGVEAIHKRSLLPILSLVLSINRKPKLGHHVRAGFSSSAFCHSFNFFRCNLSKTSTLFCPPCCYCRHVWSSHRRFTCLWTCLVCGGVMLNPLWSRAVH